MARPSDGRSGAHRPRGEGRVGGRRRRLPRAVRALALAVVSTLIWVVAGPAGPARALTACTASLCVLSSSATDALNVHPGVVQVTGDVLVNSTASEAAAVSGGGSVTATGIIGGPAAPAGFATSGGATYSPTPTNQAAVTDPYASLTQCPGSSACPTTPTPPFPSVNHVIGSQTINPGVYSSITSSSGTLTLNPGTYVVTTKLSVSGGHLNGSGVTIRSDSCVVFSGVVRGKKRSMWSLR